MTHTSNLDQDIIVVLQHYGWDSIAGPNIQSSGNTDSLESWESLMWPPIQTATDCDSDLQSRYIAAGNALGSDSIWNGIVNDTSCLVRRRAAENPALPLRYLRKLSTDSSVDVRIAVAENSSTPLWLLELLSQDEDADVRYAMAENSALPAHILRQLTQDENPYVCHRAVRTVKRIDSRENIVVMPLSEFSRAAEKRRRAH